MNLKDYFAKYRVSKEEFAVRVGISFGAIANYLRGYRRPTQAIAQRIERETGGRVTVMTLRGKDDRVKKAKIE